MKPASLWILTLAVAMAAGSEGGRTGQQPNVILMLADDLGWTDLERHDPEMRTPSLSRLADESLFLNQAYVMPTCAPTRSALLTGKYPYTYGMQVNEIKGAKKAWLNETLTLLPSTLQDLGYRTHMIGKWHLGFCNWALTPTRRGFHTFYGFYSGAQGYFNHSGNNPNSFDFRDQDEVVWSARGKYSTELHTTRAQRILREHGRRGPRSQEPFFLYMAYQNVHAPFEAKQAYVDRYCSHVTNHTRRLHCGMVAALDESVGNITSTLQEQGLANNTVIIFMSDNGAPVEGGAFNWPFRGKKATLWEGGTKSYTLLHLPQMPRERRNTTYSGLVHAIDWFPTIVRAAGGRVPGGLDGLPMWNTLSTGASSPRTEFVYNVDDRNRRSALRWNNWKLTKGKPGRKYNGWYSPPSMGGVWREVRGRRVPRMGLFNLASDPYERTNLFRSRRHRSLKRRLIGILRDYERRLWPWRAAQSEPRGRPVNFGGVYTPGWCSL